MNLKKLKNLIENNQEGGSKPPFCFTWYGEVIIVNGKRLEILRLYPTEFLMEMLDNMEDLSEQAQKEALEEITYILFEREVKHHLLMQKL